MLANQILDQHVKSSLIPLNPVRPCIFSENLGHFIDVCKKPRKHIANRAAELHLLKAPSLRFFARFVNTFSDPRLLPIQIFLSHQSMHDRKDASLLVKRALHLPVIREQPCDMGARTERVRFACTQQRVNLSCREHIAERLTFRYAFDQYLLLWSEIHCWVRPARGVHASLKPFDVCK